jgi:AcrR family transcriptional regulator
MGRKRIISEDRILDAAQYVVAQHGAGQLTIDAVAERAGISKASVLYLYKSKRALMEAIVRRAVRYDSDFNEAAIQSFGSVDGSVVRGRILAATEFLPGASRSVALDLCAAVAQDPQLRKPMQVFQNSIIARIAMTSAHPRGVSGRTSQDRQPSCVKDVPNTMPPWERQRASNATTTESNPVIRPGLQRHC